MLMLYLLAVRNTETSSLRQKQSVLQQCSSAVLELYKHNNSVTLGEGQDET